jgi:hypothetical protein
MFNACSTTGLQACRKCHAQENPGCLRSPRPHWVGNGFPVRSLFSYGDHGKALSPFCCWIMQALRASRPPRHGAAWARIRTAA